MVQRHLLSTKKMLDLADFDASWECFNGRSITHFCFVCFEQKRGLFLQHFHMVILIVQDACKALADHHLHVNVSVCAYNLARWWMVHGNDRSFRKK